MNFKELREASGMNIKAFGAYFGIPYRTIQNWAAGVRNCPGYLLELMEYKLQKEGFLEEDLQFAQTPRTGIIIPQDTFEKAQAKLREKNAAPFGYYFDGNGELKINEEEAEKIRQGIEEYIKKFK